MKHVKAETKCIFQGDVAMLRMPDGFKIPDGWQMVAPEEKGICLAYGEQTGHAHAFKQNDYENVEVYRNPANDNQMFVLVKNAPAALLHEEHTGYELPPGSIWWKGQQHEYDFEGEYRVVAD